jgi:hypothetical protein
MDIKQALNACAVVTLGKDMTFRDYSQGAYRMRGIGQGQTIHLFIIPEVLKLIKKEVKNSSSLIIDVAAWLTVNSVRSEKLQFFQLCQQSLRNVWRKRAFYSLLEDTTNPLHDSKRFWRFREQTGASIAWLKTSVKAFREPIDFSVDSDIDNTPPFEVVLKQEADDNKAFIDRDPKAPAELKL